MVSDPTLEPLVPPSPGEAVIERLAGALGASARVDTVFGDP